METCLLFLHTPLRRRLGQRAGHGWPWSFNNQMRRKVLLLWLNSAPQDGGNNSSLAMISGSASLLHLPILYALLHRMVGVVFNLLHPSSIPKLNAAIHIPICGEGSMSHGVVAAGLLAACAASLQCAAVLAPLWVRILGAALASTSDGGGRLPLLPPSPPMTAWSKSCLRPAVELKQSFVVQGADVVDRFGATRW